LAVQPASPHPAENVVEIQADGPVYFRGSLRLQKLSGETLLEDDSMALCRCGQSQNKPLCDNAHLKAGFRAPAALGRLAADGGEGPAGLLSVATAPNGPLLLDGPVEIRGGGASVKVRKAALCRCGLSENKPYCDGSHATGGFQAD
jgi:CDGSH-type Zn-finger protein